MKRISLCFCIMTVFFAAIGFSGCKQATENSNSGSSVDTSLWPRVYDPDRIVGGWKGILTETNYDTGEKVEYDAVLEVYNYGSDSDVTLTGNGFIFSTGSFYDFSNALNGDLIIRLSPDGNSIYFGEIGSGGSMEGILRKVSY